MSIKSITPSDIPGLKFWLKADSLTLNDNDAVTTWSDSSGNGFSASSSSSAPLFKTNIQNHLPAVYFDGVHNQMTISPVVSGQPHTITFVAKKDDFFNNAGRVVDGTVGGRIAISIGNSGHPDMYTGTTLTTIGDIINTQLFHVYTFVFNGSSSKIYIDGVLNVTGNCGTASGGNMFLGGDAGGATFQGHLLEFVDYDFELSSDNVRDLYNGFKTKWALPTVTGNPRKVHFVYLIPSDRTNNSEDAIRKTALHLQAWYRWQMGNGKTFTLSNPIVEVYHTPHTAEFYSTNDVGGAHGNWWRANVINDTVDLTGQFIYSTPFADWVIYCDSEPAADQLAGGSPGVCLLHAHDLASIRNMSSAEQIALYGSYWTQCRGIGGHGHEFGHTMGLPHPPGPPNPDWPRAIMGIGYGSYPNAILTASDKVTLNANPFFGARAHLAAPTGLCPFDDGVHASVRPPPHGRPHPVPVRR